MTNYYILKEVLNRLPNVIKEKIEYNDELLLNLTSFYDTALFFSYPKDDKYNLYNKIIESDDKLILELAVKLSKDNSFEKLLLLYAIASKIVFNQEIKKYLANFDIDYDEALNQMDYYYLNKFNDDNNIFKKFKNSFNYYDYFEDLIHYPFVKLYSFYSTKTYYKRAYKRERKYYKKYKYKTIDTKILNMDKSDLIIGTEKKKKNYNLDEYIETIINSILVLLVEINEYLFENKEKSLRKLFNLSDDYKI